MTSKNRSRQRRAGRGSGRSGGPSGLRASAPAWLMTASGTNAAGVEQASVNWGGATQTLAANTTVTFQPVILPEAVTAGNAPPSIGECDIVGLDATIDITSVSVAGRYLVGLSCYVADYFAGNTTWEVKDPCLAADAGDQDLLHLVAHAFNSPLVAADSGPVSIQLRVVLPFPIRIGSGQALHVTLSNDTSSAGVISFTPFVRAKINHIS